MITALELKVKRFEDAAFETLCPVLGPPSITEPGKTWLHLDVSKFEAGNFLAEGTICLLAAAPVVATKRMAADSADGSCTTAQVATCLLMTGRMYNLNIQAGTPWAKGAPAFAAFSHAKNLQAGMPCQT